MATGEDISVLSLGGDGQPEPFLNSEHNERMPAPSPDGRWVAFVSDESGRNEVYVSPYPASGARMPVFRAGGMHPAWAPSGRELFYRNGDSLMVAQVNTGLDSE
ncbi:MAG: PD40 domain-containing protein [Gemmatimonadetes bacterium]|nr:PD40 domain-containing protein [Gemmatimonadota bacterium]